MAITLNKKVRASIVESAVEAKYKVDFDKSYSEFVKAARVYAVSKSHDEVFSGLGLSEDLLSYVKTKSHFEVRRGVDTSDVPFFNKESISYVGFNPVRACDAGYYISDESVPALGSLRKLVKEISVEKSRLACVLGSYKNIKKLIEDLPWVEQYLPEASAFGTGLIAVDAINDINAKFGK